MVQHKIKEKERTNKATDGALKRKRASELAAMSKAHFAKAVELDKELKGMDDELGNTDR